MIYDDADAVAMYGFDPNGPQAQRQQLTAVAVTDPSPRLAEELFLAARRSARIPGEYPFRHHDDVDGWKALISNDGPSSNERGCFHDGPGDAGLIVHHANGEAVPQAALDWFTLEPGRCGIGDVYAIAEVYSHLGPTSQQDHERIAAELGVWCDAKGLEWSVLPDLEVEAAVRWLPRGEGYVPDASLDAARARAAAQRAFPTAAEAVARPRLAMPEPPKAQAKPPVAAKVLRRRP